MAQGVRLSRLTALRVGGKPREYFRPRDEEELRGALAECRDRRMPWRVLGGGSNLLVEDGDLPYAVIHIAPPGFGSVERAGRHGVRAGAGLRSGALLAFCRDEGLGGLEFLAGLPGSVGGAVAGNAGAWEHHVSDRLSRVHLIGPDGGRRVLPPERLRFGYRTAELDGAIVTAAEFALEPRDPELIGARMDHCIARRQQRHPAGLSAGCIFKNPPGESAGRLLDLCGLKGRRVGGAEVSRQHANFILNRGAASTRDVLALIAQMKRAVRRRFGIELELEVRHWPAARRRVA
ncbi:MAG: UDP-N-acetylmuramate dehydrogenase [Candidatus Brocadiia bacterium]